MKLILHIGTHKTATTSIQHFCALNRSTLEEHGFYYPENESSAYVFNFLASKIIFKKENVVRDFLVQAKENAKKKNCHTVVISAESFYAMTTFFITVQNRDSNKSYWTQEQNAIQTLHKCCQIYSDIKISSYLRPQEDFSYSLYNQFVKNTAGISDDFETFYQKISTALDYNKHLNIWRDTFGKESLSVHAFDDHKKNIIEHFTREHLNADVFNKARKKIFAANERLNRTVLEAKRVYNLQRRDKTEGFLAGRVFLKLNKKYPDTKGDQIFTSVESRKSLFALFERGNEMISAEYNINKVRAFDLKTYPSYQRADDEEYKAINKTVQNRLKYPQYYILAFIKRQLLKLDSSSGKIRSIKLKIQTIKNKIRLKYLGW